MGTAIERLRAKMKKIHRRKTTVEFSGVGFDVHEPTYAVLKMLDAEDAMDSAIILIRECVTFKGTDESPWEGDIDAMKDLPSSLVKVLSEAAAAFLAEDSLKTAAGN